MAYEDFKDFPMRTASVSVLRDKAFNIAKDISAIKSEIMSNQQSAKELRKAPIQHATSRERPLMVLFWLRRPGP